MNGFDRYTYLLGVVFVSRQPWFHRVVHFIIQNWKLDWKHKMLNT